MKQDWEKVEKVPLPGRKASETLKAKRQRGRGSRGICKPFIINLGVPSRDTVKTLILITDRVLSCLEVECYSLQLSCLY
jgi:hypothetical protein